MGIVRVAGMAGVCLLATGCSYFDPYVLPEIGMVGAKAPTAECSKTALPYTCQTVQDIKNPAMDVRKRLTSSVVTRRSLDLATFGLAAAAGAKLLTGSATSNSTLNLAYGGVASYTANALFFPPTTEGLYLSADTALVCVAGKGSGLAARAAQAKAHLDSSKTVLTCSDPTDAGRERALVETTESWLRLFQTLRLVESADVPVAERLADASRNVLNALNQQLLAERPSSQAIFASAMSMSSLVGGAVTSQQEKDTALQGVAVPLTDVDKNAKKTCVPSAAELLKAKAILDQVNEALIAQFNGLDNLLSGCVAQASPVPEPMTIKPQAVSLVAGGSPVVLVISGGRQPILSQWTESPGGGDQDIRTIATPSTIELIPINPGLSGDFSLRVYDSSIVPKSIEVKVTVVKP